MGMLNGAPEKSETGEGLDAQACLEEVDRLVRSPLLSSSEALCKLLHFLAHHALDSPTEHIKEYEIATQVFGRSPHFDPQADSGVRVQMARLRTKLAEYYESDGVNDAIQVEVPKRSYSLLFRQRAVESHPEMSEKDALSPSGKRAPIPFRRIAVVVAGVVVCALVATAILVYVSHRPPALRALNNQAAQVMPSSLRTFWSPFLQPSEKSFVVFSNAKFVGSPVTGMRYFDAARDSRDQVSELYTGVGEVMGVEELEGLFIDLGRQIEIKRGGLFSLDDARNNDLIFVGSPTENLTLGEIPRNSGFIFKRLPAGFGNSTEGIIDIHPQNGGSGVYVSSPESRPFGTDYAVITLTHGLAPSRWTLILAGASTIGTEAAVDYTCNPDSVGDLLHRLNVPLGTTMKPFEALLRVKTANDVPLTSELVIFRKIESPGESR